jgi:predicted amidohydrolase
MDSQADKRANLDKASRLIHEASARGAGLVCLPEYFNFIGPAEDEFSAAEPIPGPTTETLASLAKKEKIWLHGGSILERVSGKEKLYNTTVVFDPHGEIVTRYRKIHLFDIEVTDGPAMTESDTKDSGEDIVTCDTDLGRLGLTICYDMRFPELYRILALKGAKIMVVPAEYTLFTGRDHWEPVLRTRAIENQVFILAPAQIGVKPLFQTYGRSLVVDPWGTVIAKATDVEMTVVVDLDMDYLERVREQIPCLRNRKPSVYKGIR